MSHTPATTSSSNFRTIFVAALKAYERKTKTDLLTHPLATQLQSCNSSSDVLAVLHDKVNEFEQSRSHNERLSSWLNPTINVLYAFSATLGEGVGLIFSPAKVISAGVGVLLLVSIVLDPFTEGFSTAMSVRPPRMSTRVKKPLPISSSVSRTSSNASNLTRKCQ
ncbi:hypothetical protein BJY52DRAFT_1322201 [Lactarius psammicola]|nr:hypothetical protein BJY52DRAFT_1322201 [Lactarius psammicola]